MGIKFSNNASANIIRALTSTATSVSVTAGKGDLFPSLTEGDYFYATLAGNNGLEIVKVTNRVNDTMTIVRAQDNTTALSFDTGDLFELRIVAADFNDTFSEVNDKLEASISEVNDKLEASLEETTSIVNSALSSKAPIFHASGSTEYGAGSSEQYGHLKSHDEPDSTLTAASGHAFSPAGAAAMQDVLEGQIGDLAGVVSGNAASQSVKDAEQDAAISAAQSTANAKIASIDMDGLDLVLTYGDGTVKRVQVPAGKSVGDLWFGFDPMSKPANVQTYEGQLLSRAAYVAHSAFVLGGRRKVLSEDAWQEYVAEKGFCPFYSSGDGSTTYRMPLMDGVHPKFVAAWAEAGQYVEAGLPNITGTFATEGRLGNSAPTGAFYLTGKTTEGAQGAGTDHILGLDASRSSPVYGNSDSVQPPAVTMVVGEYVVGSVATIGEADAVSLMEAINAKADADVAGNGVVRSVNGVSADAAGNVSDIVEFSYTENGKSDYIRYSNGIQICWGYTEKVNSASGTTVSFPAAFARHPGVTVTMSVSATGNWGNFQYWLGNLSNTSFKVYSTTGLDGKTVKNWIAIGLWK